MKYFKRLKQYKASNVLFDIETERAYSYGHWCFFKDGVFNNTTYSSSTSQHQSKMHTLLRELGIQTILTLSHTTYNLNGNITIAIDEERKALIKNIHEPQLKLNALKKKDGSRGKLYQSQVETAYRLFHEFCDDAITYYANLNKKAA